MEHVMEIYKDLSSKLESQGIKIENSSQSNSIIMALAVAYGNGVELGEISGRSLAITDMQEKIKSL